MFRLDTWFSIGDSHEVNQDYALSGTNPVPHLIVADGCSSSAHTDVGARLLSWAASGCLADQEIIRDPGSYAVHRAQFALNTLQLPLEAEENGAASQGSMLDATLLMVYVIEDYVHIKVYGDGIVAMGRCDGDTSVLQVEYSHNAPLYLSYLLDPLRASQWQRQSLNEYKLLQQQGMGISRVSIEKDKALSLCYPKNSLAWVLLATDGLASFINSSNNKPLDVQSVVKSLTNFKNINGAFLKRRVKRQLGDWAKQNVVNDDDLGMACMLFSG